MKKATVIIWAIISVFIGIIFYDNWDIISNKISLSIRSFGEPLPPLPIFIYFIIFFFFGFIIAYLFNLSVRFKARRTTKKLNTAITSHKDEAAKLKSELNTLKGQDTPAPLSQQAAESKTGTDEIIELTGDRLVENPADQQEANPAKDSKEEKSKKKS